MFEQTGHIYEWVKNNKERIPTILLACSVVVEDEVKAFSLRPPAPVLELVSSKAIECLADEHCQPSL